VLAATNEEESVSREEEEPIELGKVMVIPLYHLVVTNEGGGP